MKGKGKTNTWVIGGIIATVLIAGLVGLGLLSVPATVQPVCGNGICESGETIANCPGDCVGDLKYCDPTTTPQVTITMSDADNPGTTITEVMSWRRSGQTLWTSTNTGTAITGLSYGETIEYVVGINTTDAELYDNAYSNKGTFKVKCQEAETIEVEGHNDEVEASITATFYDSDDTASTTQTITADATKTVYLKFEAGNDEEYGNRYITTYPNIISIKVNSTDTVDVPKVFIVDTELGTEGATMTKIGCPSIVSATTSFTNYCFEAPTITDQSVKLGVKITAYSSGSIITDGTASYYAGNWFINADTGKLEYGIQDEDGNACGASDPDTLTVDLV